MPVGSPFAFLKVNQCVQATNPATILDLGIGYGMNGAGIRNWYSMDCEVVGVEIFPAYRNAMWGCYNEVVISDIKSYLATCKKFDMVIMTDVIEHFTAAEGKDILRLIKNVAAKSAVVSTPLEWFDQGAVHGNPYEKHKSHWSAMAFDQNGFGIVDMELNLGHDMLIAEYVAK